MSEEHVEERRRGSHELYSRIGKIETEQASILTSLNGLTKAVADLGAEIHNIRDGSKINWGAWASWSAVMLIAMTTIGTLSLQPIVKTLDTHINQEGHMEAIKQSVRLDEKVSQLELRIAKNEEHSSVEGHPHVQISEIESVKKMLEEKTKDRFSATEGRAMSERIKRIEYSIANRGDCDHGVETILNQ